MAAFHNPESNTNGLKTGSDSSAVAAKAFAAASQPSFRTFQFYKILADPPCSIGHQGLTLCVTRSGNGSKVKSSSWSAMCGKLANAPSRHYRSLVCRIPDKIQVVSPSSVAGQRDWKTLNTGKGTFYHQKSVIRYERYMLSQAKSQMSTKRGLGAE